MWPILKRKDGLIEIYPKITQMLELTDKNFKVTITTVLIDMKGDVLIINGKKKSNQRNKKYRKIF